MDKNLKIWNREGEPIKCNPIYKINNCIEGDFNSNEEIINNYSKQLRNIALLDNMEFCFNYALKIKFKFLTCIEDSINILFSTYKQIKFKNINKGDIVLFRDDWDYLHLGIIWKKGKSVNDTFIRAKFGQLGIYEHKLKDTPTCYGNMITFWRKQK